jgi:hypothetical protein
MMVGRYIFGELLPTLGVGVGAPGTVVGVGIGVPGTVVGGGVVDAICAII